MDERATSDRIKLFMQELAEYLKPTFPQYAAALAHEVHGTRMTNERWNRVAAILASLAALPGACFVREEHDARNPALSSVVIAQQMAVATFGGDRNVESNLSLAAYIADEISERIGSRRA